MINVKLLKSLLTRIDWQIEPAYQYTPAAEAFSSLEAVFALQPQGSLASYNSESQVFRHEVAGANFYVKRYHSTKGIRSWLGWSRIKIEWQNQLLFHQLGLPAAQVVAYGQRRCLNHTLQGAMITYAVEDTCNLATMGKASSPLLRNHNWIRDVCRQVARAARLLHDYRFAHNDFVWRNILVTQNTESPKIYLIDCPTGQRWFGPFLRYRIRKDLACLDKLARHHLSRTERLRFFLAYSQQTRLDACDKKAIRKILTFFEGRE